MMKTDATAAGSAGPDPVGARVARSSAAGVAAQALYLATRFAITPYVVATAGLEVYGFWSVLFVILGVFGVHRMGFASASVAFVARHHAEGRRDRIDAVLGASATLALAAALLLGGALILGAPLLVSALGTSDALRAEAILALRVTVAATFASLVLGGFQSALEGMQEYPAVKAVDAAALLLETGAVVAALALGWGLTGLAGAYALRLLAPIPAYAALARRRLPGLRALPGRLDADAARALLGLGGSVQVLGVLHLAIASLDRLVLAHLVSLGAAGAYEVARKLVSFAGALPAHALGPLVPAAAALRARAGGEPLVTAPLVRTATRAVAIAAAAPLATFGACAGPLVGAWVGPGHDDVALAVAILAPAAYIHLATGPATAVLRGLALPRLELAYAVLWLVLGAALMPLGAARAGVAGVALGSAAAQAGASLTLLLYALPLLGVRRRALLRDVAGPALAALPYAALAAVTARTSLLPEERLPLAIFAAGACALVAAGAITGACAFVLPRSEREVVAALARRIVARCLNFLQKEKPHVEGRPQHRDRQLPLRAAPQGLPLVLAR